MARREVITREECEKLLNALLDDYEIVTDNEDNLMWQLAGTNQNYTSKEMIEAFIEKETE